jgi:RNA polymerase sigma-70 factor (ECF subfamily)
LNPFGVVYDAREREGMAEGGPGKRVAEADLRHLVEKVAGGDHVAFRWLFRRFQRPVHAYLSRLVRLPHIADELMNETMLELWRGAGRFGGRSTVSTWLFGIARHKAIDHLRRMRNGDLGEEIIADMPDPAPTPEDSVGKASLSELVGRLMNQLSVEHREVLHLAYREELSVEEIAGVVDCPVNTVKTRMFYARKRLKTLLVESGVEEP